MSLFRQIIWRCAGMRLFARSFFSLFSVCLPYTCIFVLLTNKEHYSLLLMEEVFAACMLRMGSTVPSYYVLRSKEGIMDQVYGTFSFHGTTRRAAGNKFLVYTWYTYISALATLSGI